MRRQSVSSRQSRDKSQPSSASRRYAGAIFHGPGRMALFGSQRSAVSPLTLALIGVLAYRTMHGKGRLAEMLGVGSGGAGPGNSLAGQPQTGAAPGSVGNLGG